MAYCTNCGKKVTLLKRIPLAYVAAGAAALVSALIGPKDMPLTDRIFLALPKSLGQDPPRPVNVQVNIDTEAGAVWYCSAKCRDNDLRTCYRCKRYFSLKKTGVVEDNSIPSVCPSCSRKVKEVERVYQELMTTMRSGEELLSYAEQHPEDPSACLKLACYYLDYGKKWMGYESQPYPRAVKAAFGLADENFRKALALGLDSLGEGKAHYWIAYLRRHPISDSDTPSLGLSYRARELEKLKKQHEKQVEKDANAALRASIKAVKRHLRSNPHDVEALRLLKSAYETLGKTDELYDIEVRLQKAEVLRSTQEQSQVEQEPRIGKSGIPFEEKCLRLLQQMGFTASSTTATNDGGIDIIAIHSQPMLAGKYIIQCKDWKSNVGVAVVRELYGVVNAEGANKGILITSSAFTKGAEEFAQGKPIELIDGEQLERLIEEHLVRNEVTS